MKVRLYSHIGQVSGFGRAGTELAASLLRAGVELEISAGTSAGERTLPVAPAVAACIKAERNLDPRPDICIVHTLPRDCLRLWERLVGTGAFGYDYLPRDHLPHAVAYTSWETPLAPGDLTDSLEVFDQVWVPSSVTEDALTTPDLAHKLRVVPHAFDEATYAARDAGSRPACDPYRFYYVGAWTQRKNPAGLIRAYCHAFTRDEPVELVLQLGPTAVEEIALVVGSTGLDASRQPVIRPRIETISDEALLELHRSCDCFVTASRGEAFNLGAFDAMLAGNHVIAPRHQGSDDFLGNTTAALYGSHPGIAVVDAKLIKQAATAAGPGAFAIQTKSPDGLDGKTMWLEPDLLELSTYMRAAARDRVRRMIGPDPRARFGYAAVGQLATQYLQEILDDR